MTDEEYFEQLCLRPMEYERVTHVDTPVPYKDITVIARKYSTGSRKFFYYDVQGFNNNQGMGYHDKETLYKSLAWYLRKRLYQVHLQGLDK